MGRRSKSDLFDLTERILELYTKQKLTIKEIEGQLQNEGYNISRESVRRSLKNSKEIAKELQKNIEEARVIMESVKNNPNTDIMEAAVTRIGGLFLKESMQIESLIIKDPFKFAQAAAQLAGAQAKLTATRMQYKDGFEEAKKAVVSALKNELAAHHPELFERLCAIVDEVKVA